MIRILAGASPVLRNVKPSIGGVCVCALGHYSGRVNSHSYPRIETSKRAPLPRFHLGMPQDSDRFLSPFASQVERILGAGAGLSGVGQEATTLSKWGTLYSTNAHL